MSETEAVASLDGRKRRRGEEDRAALPIENTLAFDLRSCGRREPLVDTLQLEVCVYLEFAELTTLSRLSRATSRLVAAYVGRAEQLEVALPWRGLPNFALLATARHLR